MSITVIQTASNDDQTSTATSLTLTFASNVTAGNCIVVVAANDASTGVISGITLGGSADNWTKDAGIVGGNGGFYDIEIWSDPGCAGGSKTVVITWLGSGDLAAVAYEVSGLAASPLDKTQTNGPATTGTSFTSNATTTTSQASELYVGGVWMQTNGTISGPSSPWTNTKLTLSTAGEIFQAGFEIASVTGTPSYAGTISGDTQNNGWVAAIVTFKAGSGTSTPSKFTPPKTAKGRQAAIRGTGKGSPGAKYIAFPSKFTPSRRPARGGQAATRGRSRSTSGTYVHVVPPGPSPFTLPTHPAKGQQARPGRSHGQPGAPYVAFPSPFTLPSHPSRAVPPARRGSGSGHPGAQYVAIPAVFVLPGGPARGRQSAVKGKSSGSPGARFVLIRVSRFTLPVKSARGAQSARRGTWSAGSATGQGAPVIPRKLIIAIASQAGRDDYGNPFVQGIQVNQGLIQGQVIAAESIVKGILAPGAVDDFTLNAVQVNSGTVVASDIIISGTSGGQFAYSSGGTITNVFTTSGTWKAPAGVTSIQCECWAGGGGGGGTNASDNGGGGGGGGEYARENTLAVTPGTTYTFTVGAAGSGGGASFSNGSNGGNTTFPGDSVTVTAHGGGGGHSASSFGLGGAGGTGSGNSVHFNGGSGQSGANISAGGGSGGTGSAGNPGGANGFGAAAVTGGGPGGDLDNSPVTGPGGSGGGYGTFSGADGWAGQIMITYTSSSPQLIASIAGAATTDPVASVNVPEGMASDHYTVSSNASVPGTPSGGGVFWYDGTSLWFKGTSGTAVKIATT